MGTCHLILYLLKKPESSLLRQQGDTIGRINFVHLSAGEHFHQYLLLTVVKGAKSFEDIHTYVDIVHPTYKAACLAHGFLTDDREWDKCLQEAGDMQTGGQLRFLFGYILLHCQPAMPAILWDHHKEKICDDLKQKIIDKHHIPAPTDEQIYDYGLFLLDWLLLKSEKHLLNFDPMPLL